MSDDDETTIEVYSTELQRQIGFIKATPDGLLISIDDDIAPAYLGAGFTLEYNGEMPLSFIVNVARRIEATRQASLNLQPGSAT